MNQRYSYSGEGDGWLGSPERRLALRQSALLALLLTLPVLLIVILAALFPKDREGLVMTLGLVWGLTTGLFTLPWSFAAELVTALFEPSELASAIALTIGIWVSYLINMMYALTRWTAQQLFGVLGVIAVLQLGGFAIFGFFVRW